MPNLKRFRENVTIYRKRGYNTEGRPHTQEELAREIGLSAKELGHRLNGNGRSPLTKANILKIVETLSVWETLSFQDAEELLRSMDYPLQEIDWQAEHWKRLSGDRSSLLPGFQGPLPDIQVTLHPTQKVFSDDYSIERFKRDFMAYASHIERSIRFLKLIGVATKDERVEMRDPELANLFVQLRITSFKETDQGDQSSILGMLEAIPYIVLLGGPGSGKSTLIRYLAWSHASIHVLSDETLKSRTPFLKGCPLPLHIELRLFSEVRRLHPEHNFLSYVTDIRLRGAGIPIDQRLFIKLLERRNMLILFDGLDEVATLEERYRLVTDIEGFIQNYPGNRVIVTSRPLGYDLAPCSDRWFTRAKIEPLDDTQIHLFIERWCMHVLQHPPISPEDKQEPDSLIVTLLEHPQLHSLAENPLLLSVIVALHRYERLPDRRVSVYDRCADLFLDRWARLKGTNSRWQEVRLSRDDQCACLAHLAFFLHTYSPQQPQNGQEVPALSDVPLRTLFWELESYLQSQHLFSSRAEQRLQVERFLELTQEETGFLVERGTDEQGVTLYGFIHRTFQEYFAAVDVYERYLQREDTSIISELLAKHLHDPHWQEVILLLFGKLKRGPVTMQLGSILDKSLLSNRSKHTELIQQDLFFLCACLAEEIEVEITLAEQIVSCVCDVVKHSLFSSQRRKAIQALISLLKTRRYDQLVYTALKAMTRSDVLLSPIARATVILAFSLTSLKSSEEKLQLISDLCALIQEYDLSIEEFIMEFPSIVPTDNSDPEVQEQTKQVLVCLAQRSDLSIEQAVEILYLLYRYGHDPEAQALTKQILVMQNQHSGLSIEQLVEQVDDFYTPKPGVASLVEQDQARQKLGKQMVMTLAQWPDLSIEQSIALADILYSSGMHYYDIEAMELAKQMVMTLAQRSDLSVEQSIALAHVPYRVTPSDAETRALGKQMLFALAHRSDLSTRESIQLAGCLIWIGSHAEAELRERGRERLANLVQQSALTLEQSMELAHMCYMYRFTDTEVRKMGGQVLVGLAQHPNLSREDSLAVACMLYQISTNDAQERLGRELLAFPIQHADLSAEQTITLFHSIDKFMKGRYGEWAWELTEVLLGSLLQRVDLSVEQTISLATIFCHRYGIDSEQRKLAKQLLWNVVYNPDATSAQQLHAITILLEEAGPTYADQEQALHIILCLLSQEQAKQYLADHWHDVPGVQIVAGIPQLADVSYLVELAQQELLPFEVLDGIYWKLNYMVPYFDRIRPDYA